MDEMIKKLTAKNGAGPTLRRLSDTRTAVYGSGRTSAELTYLRGQNTDAATVNTHWADAWEGFAGLRSATSARGTQKRREFFRNQTYP